MSYATLAEAYTYAYGLLRGTPFTTASDGDRQKALDEATSRIDALTYNGEKTDVDQVNQFPRDEDTEVPDDIKNACTEIAIKLLDGYNDDLEFEDQRIIQSKIGSLSTFHDRSSPSLHKIAGIPSIIAWRLLLPYMVDPREVRINRIS
jgi:hypothetical protein